MNGIKKLLAEYLPGLILFIIAAVIGLAVYQDYGMAWDEPFQRDFGLISYDCFLGGSKNQLINTVNYHGCGFEIVLAVIEKWLNITDSRDIYLMRHLASHLFFLVSCYFGYVLVYRLFRSRFLACLGFIMLAFMPRIYVHSFVNSKDIPFLCALIIAFAACEAAFQKRNYVLFIAAGAFCGFATSIRIAGVILYLFIALFLLIDTAAAGKQQKAKPFRHLLVFSAAFALFTYLFWPYLWKNPVNNFAESCRALAHFDWAGNILFRGGMVNATRLPWTYFPVWFGISTPLLWLVAGICGMVWLIIDFIKHPAAFLTNTPSRNFLLYLLFFLAPVLAAILLHSVIYDDWRHLYFVYPAFALLAVYGLNKLLHTRYKLIVQVACAAQVCAIGWFMISSHPFQQVYFNELVPRDAEYLRRNYELDYWGCGYKQALDYLVATHPYGDITIAPAMNPLANNILMLQTQDRKRIITTDGNPEYEITSYRAVPFHYYDTMKLVYSVRVLNSSVLGVYRLR